MPTNREIVFNVRMRNLAREAMRQLNADLAAQGTTLKQVARQLQDVQVQTARMGQAAGQADRSVSRLAVSAKGLGQAANDVAAFAKAIGTAAGSSTGFKAIEKAVDGLDRAFRTSGGLGVYRARLMSLQSVLAALPGQFAVAAAAAAGLSGVAPPRAPRGNGSAGAPPASNGPPVGGSGSAQDDFNRRLADTKSRLDTMQNQLRTVAALTVSAFGARQVLAMADAYTQIIGQLKLVTTGTANLRQAYEALYASAQNNHTSLDTSVQLYARFNKATNTLGVSQREVLEVTDAVGKSIAIFGGNAQSADAALYQFSQGLASGVLRGEELNSVMEQAPRLAQTIADGLKNDAGTIGIPIGALRSYAEQGKLTTEAVFQALQNQRPKLEAEAKGMGLTVGKAFTNAKNAFTDFIGKADEASGASRRVAQAIIDGLKALQTPEAISAAQTALTGFATAASAAIKAVAFLANNVQLAVTAFVALKLLPLAGIFAAAGSSAVTAAGSLAVYSVATRGVVVGATAANVAVNGLSAALRVFGGPIGFAITAAATALAFWATSTKDSVVHGTELAGVTDRLKSNYDEAANAVKNLTEAERARDKLKVQGVAKGFADEIAAQAKSLNSAIGAGAFEATDGSRLAARFMPFREEVEAFRKTVRDGKADFDGLQKAVATKAEKSPTLADAARELNEAAEAGRKAQDGFEKAAATLKVLEGTATQAQAAVAGVTDTLAKPMPIDGNTAFTGYVENLKQLAANVPQLKAAADATDAVGKASTQLGMAQRNLKAAFDAGVISQGEFEDRQAELERTMQRARDAINGLTQAQRDLRDAERDLGLDGLVDRDRAVESINIKYDRQLRSLKEQVQAQKDNAQAVEGLHAAMRKNEALRQQDIGNLDVKFQNNELRDRILSLQGEARLLDLSGGARERASRLLDIENAARRAGVSNVQGMVDAYGKEYDALKRAEQARQTVGTGFKRAVDGYIESTARVADESERMFGSMFNNLSDGFVDTVRTGKDGFRSMLDSISSDLMRFASRQLFRTLLSSVFGDGQGGTGAGTSFGAQVLSALGMGASKAVGGGVAASAASTGIGAGLGNAANAAASGVVQLSSAATDAASSFGDIPSKLTTMLKGLGATDAGVAGFLGNVQRESGFRPGAVNETSGAYGLIQALGPRKAELFRQYGSSPSADQQIDFIRGELLTTEKASLNMLRSSSTLADGVKAGIRFERPEGYVDALRAGDLSQVPDFGTRMGFANKFGSVGQPGAGTGTLSLEGVTLSEESLGKLNDQIDQMQASMQSVDTSFSQMGGALEKSKLGIVSGADGISTTLSNGGNQVGQALEQVSANVSKSGNSLFEALSALASKASGSVTMGANGLIDIGKGFAGDGFDLNVGDMADWLHTGGIIGQAARVQRTASPGLWDGAPKFHTGGIVGGLKSRERAIIAKDEEAIFPTVRMSDGNFGIRATGFTGGEGGGGNITIGDINVRVEGSSGNPQQDDAYAKMMGREMRAAVRAEVADVMTQQARSGGMFRKMMKG
ncbi:phage tail tip lysozyme [Methylorubrum sp. SB2]|uniref:phage tail tip lysozyme n=1 Tax=Methylorubrum subtropicum TaxID=3138812 RepID=UPI00313F1928